MPGDRTPGKPTTLRYTEQEKVQVRLVRQLRAELGSDVGTVTRVAEQVGHGVETLRKWVHQADIDEGRAAGVSTTEAERIKALEQEVRELRPPVETADLEVGVDFLRGGARPPTAVMVDYVDRHKGEFGIEPICEVPQFAPPPTSSEGPAGVGARDPRRRDEGSDRDRPPGQLRGLRGPQNVEGDAPCWQRHRPRPGRPVDARTRPRGVRRGKRVRTTRADEKPAGHRTS